MRFVFLKYICLPLVCLTSGYSYIFLNKQSTLLSERLSTKTTPKETHVIIRNPKNNSTQVVIIAPPKDTAPTTKDKKKEEYAQKSGNMLPDVEFLKFIFDKGKEGIPVLRFDGFLAAFR